MSTTSSRIKIRSGDTEVEIDSPMEEMAEKLSLVRELFDIISQQGKGVSRHSTLLDTHLTEDSDRSTPPEITLSTADSLTETLTKLFQEPWGSQPRRLQTVREAIAVYGLRYPKQSVAVSLLRMAKSGKLRRFKNNSGEYIYTASALLRSRSDIEHQISSERIKVLTSAKI